MAKQQTAITENEIKPLSNRAQKSEHTRRKIIEATFNLLSNYGYDHVTVRNICEAADVSNGTFYHFFQSKDDVLGEYLRKDVISYDADPDEVGLIEYIIEGYLRITREYVNLGIDFVISYYTPKNQAFNVRTRRPGVYMSDKYYPLLIKAQEDGYIYRKASPEQIAHDTRCLVIGNTFQWAANEGKGDLVASVERMLRDYLYSIFTPAYFRRYGKK